MVDISSLLDDREKCDQYMQRALVVAQQSLPDDIPIGALIIDVETEIIISQACNSRQRTHNATDHAEVVAIRDACEKLSSKRLHNCVLFTTLEPCVMCAGSLIQAHIGGVIFGAYDPQYGAAGSIYNFFSDPRLSHNAPVVGGVRANECAEILTTFFENIRASDPRST